MNTKRKKEGRLVEIEDAENERKLMVALLVNGIEFSKAVETIAQYDNWLQEQRQEWRAEARATR